MPKKALTGTQFKAQKAATKGAIKREKHAYRAYKHGIRELENQPTDIVGILKQFEQAGQGAEKIFQPMKENAIAEYEQLIPSQLRNQAVSTGGGARSSALNQALFAGRSQLNRQLEADYSSLKANLAQNLMGQLQGNIMNRINVGQNQSPVLQALAQSPTYLQKSGGPSGFAKYAPLVGTALGAAAGSLVPAVGTLAGAQLGGMLGGGASALGSVRGPSQPTG